jgi:hypothetical protein
MQRHAIYTIKLLQILNCLNLLYSQAILDSLKRLLIFPLRVSVERPLLGFS